MLLLFFTNCKKQRTFESSYTKLRDELLSYGDAYWTEGYVKKVILTKGKPEKICCSFFEKTPELEELYIRHANIKGLNEKIIGLKKLKVLHLDLQLPIEDLAILERLPQLEVLYIRSKAYKSLAEIDLNWQRFKNLRSLTLSYADPLTQFEVSLPSTVPPDIFKLSNLEQLHIDGWNLSAFPAEIVDLKNLHTLSMQTYVQEENVSDQQAAAKVFQELLKIMPHIQSFKLDIQHP